MEAMSLRLQTRCELWSPGAHLARLTLPRHLWTCLGSTPRPLPLRLFTLSQTLLTQCHSTSASPGWCRAAAPAPSRLCARGCGAPATPATPTPHCPTLRRPPLRRPRRRPHSCASAATRASPRAAPSPSPPSPPARTRAPRRAARAAPGRIVRAARAAARRRWRWLGTNARAARPTTRPRRRRRRALRQPRCSARLARCRPCRLGAQARRRPRLRGQPTATPASRL
mmetsp:Transcript_34840/g.113733  ORF Transcript_34840/g.113733 Transcript_34840/m.113733 type:complete len:226 (+) Transcript_34840:804-1481(+)